MTTQSYPCPSQPTLHQHPGSPARHWACGAGQDPLPSWSCTPPHLWGPQGGFTWHAEGLNVGEAPPAPVTTGREVPVSPSWLGRLPKAGCESGFERICKRVGVTFFPFFLCGFLFFFSPSLGSMSKDCRACSASPPLWWLLGNVCSEGRPGMEITFLFICLPCKFGGLAANSWS